MKVLLSQARLVDNLNNKRAFERKSAVPCRKWGVFGLGGSVVSIAQF